MKHLTKIFVIIAIVLFIVGYYLQATGQEDSGIKLLIAAIMFMICAFINRNNNNVKTKSNNKKKHTISEIRLYTSFKVITVVSEHFERRSFCVCSLIGNTTKN